MSFAAWLFSGKTKQARTSRYPLANTTRNTRPGPTHSLRSSNSPLAIVRQISKLRLQLTANVAAGSFRTVMQQIYRRLFRLCGHLCFAHLSELDYNEFLSSFSKLITCGEHYKLISQVDFSRLEGIVSYVKKHAQQ